MTGPKFPRARVVVACADHLYQRALCASIAAEHDLAGVVIHEPRRVKGSLPQRLRRYATPKRALRYVQTRRELARYEEAAAPLVRRLFFVDGEEPAIPAGTPVVHVGDVNAPDAVKLVQDVRPDLVCVNGTNLLRGLMLDLIPSIPYGIINIHTGLSPYSRGGNCNLFMLAEGKPELVGVTIHYIDRGIDSGDIIITARPELAGDDTSQTIDAKTFRLGIDLMLVAIRQLQEGRAERVRQWEAGKLFLRRTGYAYEPSIPVRVNAAIERGLIRDYLANREARDRAVRLVGRTE